MLAVLWSACEKEAPTVPVDSPSTPPYSTVRPPPAPTGTYTFPSGSMPTPSPAFRVWTEADPGPTGPWSCATPRDADYANWSGGVRLTLSVSAIVAKGVVTMAVTGAMPGEHVELSLGDLCTLDCPTQRDGACFQPVASRLLAEGQADDAGVLSVDVPVDASWEGRWLVLQASAPEARALSRPWVDRIVDGPLQLLPKGMIRELSPAVLHNVSSEDDPSIAGSGDTFDWPVAAGRSARVSLSWQDDPGTSPTIAHAVNDVVTYLFGAETYTATETVPFRLTIETDDQPQLFTLDLQILPAEPPVEWYPDADGDGWGDDTSAPTTSAVPVPGASAAIGDCDDFDPTVFPDAPETCGDGRDQGCVGMDRSCVMGGPGGGHSGTRIVGPAHGNVGWTVRSGDLDLDGIPEILWQSGGGGNAVSVATRTDQWLFADPGWPTGAYTDAPPAVGDVTGDGMPDLVASGPVGTGFADAVRVYPGPFDSQQPWVPVVSFASEPQSVHDLQLGQLDGDIANELLVVMAQGEREMFVFDDPLASIEPVFGMEAGSFFPTLVDLDGDGVDEIVSGQGCAWASLSIADFACLLIGAYGDGPLAAEDLDGDGADDLVLALRDELVVVDELWTHGASLDTVAWAQVAAADSVVVEVAALPGGQIVASEDSGVWAVNVTGGGTFDAAIVGDRWVTDDLDWSTRALHAADLDGDTEVDLAVGTSWETVGDRSSAGTIWVLWGE